MDRRRIVSREGTDSSGKAQRAYRILLSRITGGEYRPGDRLVAEQLPRELGVSRMTVREAVRKLELEGYIVVQKHVGASVPAIDLVEYAERLESLAVLEAAATALSALHLTPEDLERARKLHRRVEEEARHELVGPLRADRELRRILYSRCPNAHLGGLVEREHRALAALGEPGSAMAPGRARQVVVENDRLLRAIEQGASAAEIERLAREQRLATANALLQRVRPGRIAARRSRVRPTSVA